MLSVITASMALAVFAAANISKAGPMETGWTAMRVGCAMFALRESYAPRTGCGFR
jgi:TRAP-type uncharacterized transport system fused permease subunit